MIGLLMVCGTVHFCFCCDHFTFENVHFFQSRDSLIWKTVHQCHLSQFLQGRYLCHQHHRLELETDNTCLDYDFHLSFLSEIPDHSHRRRQHTTILQQHHISRKLSPHWNFTIPSTMKKCGDSAENGAAQSTANELFMHLPPAANILGFFAGIKNSSFRSLRGEWKHRTRKNSSKS